MANVLIAEDNVGLRRLLGIHLRRAGYDVAEAGSGAEALDVFDRIPVHLVIADVMMPGMDGFETCEKIREFSTLPILFLTAKSAEADRLSAYSTGGDDFLSKPFSQGEILAKVRSLLRRWTDYRGKPAAALVLGNLEVDLGQRSVKNAGRDVTLTDTEYAILEHLLTHRGQTVTAADMYEAVWKEKFLPGSGNTVMVHVLNLRRKIEENPSSPKIIRTVWGKGYQID